MSTETPSLDEIALKNDAPAPRFFPHPLFANRYVEKWWFFGMN